MLISINIVLVKTPRTTKRVGGLRRKFYVVFCDHSTVGMHTSLRAAVESARDRHEQASQPIKHFVVGPYTLGENATIVEVG